jgi:UDP-N-acetyl-D-mannosaminuronate dehydrogenase
MASASIISQTAAPTGGAHTTMNLSDIKLSIIGLGYVGLPLAVEFGKKRSVMGFDINQKRITELQAGHDFTLETEPEELKAATHLRFSTQPGRPARVQLLHCHRAHPH